jgi:hypothetical protein
MGGGQAGALDPPCDWGSGQARRGWREWGAGLDGRRLLLPHARVCAMGPGSLNPPVRRFADLLALAPIPAPAELPHPPSAALLNSLQLKQARRSKRRLFVFPTAPGAGSRRRFAASAPRRASRQLPPPSSSAMPSTRGRGRRAAGSGVRFILIRGGASSRSGTSSGPAPPPPTYIHPLAREAVQAICSLRGSATACCMGLAGVEVDLPGGRTELRETPPAQIIVTEHDGGHKWLVADGRVVFDCEAVAHGWDATETVLRRLSQVVRSRGVGKALAVRQIISHQGGYHPVKPVFNLYGFVLYGPGMTGPSASFGRLPPHLVERTQNTDSFTGARLAPEPNVHYC